MAQKESFEITVPGSDASFNVKKHGNSALIMPKNFDPHDDRAVAGFVNVISMIKNAGIAVAYTDLLDGKPVRGPDGEMVQIEPAWNKAAVVSIPGGNDQAQQPTQAPPPDPQAQVAADTQQLMQQVQQLTQKVNQLEQAMGMAATPAPAATGPVPPQASVAPSPVGPGLAGV